MPVPEGLPGDDAIIIGKVTTAYGIKGWVKIHSFTEPDTNLLEYTPLFIGAPGNWRPVEIEQGKHHGKGLIAKLAGCDDRNQAELLARQQFAVHAEQLPELEDDEVYWHQLEGLLVYSIGEQDSLLGRVDGLMETGANDVLIVKPVSDSIDERERLLPYVPGEVVDEIDLDAGTIKVHWDPEF